MQHLLFWHKYILATPIQVKHSYVGGHNRSRRSCVAWGMYVGYQLRIISSESNVSLSSACVPLGHHGYKTSHKQIC